MVTILFYYYHPWYLQILSLQFHRHSPSFEDSFFCCQMCVAFQYCALFHVWEPRCQLRSSGLSQWFRPQTDLVQCLLKLPLQQYPLAFNINWILITRRYLLKKIVIQGLIFCLWHQTTKPQIWFSPIFSIFKLSSWKRNQTFYWSKTVFSLIFGPMKSLFSFSSPQTERK